MKYIIIYGDPMDGFNYRGPFDTQADATEWAEDHEPDEVWWIAELNPPTEERDDAHPI